MVVDERGKRKLNTVFRSLMMARVETFMQLLRNTPGASEELIRQRQVLLVADGAEWVKVPPLLKRLGLFTESIYELLDFTAEHLQQFVQAALPEPTVLRLVQASSKRSQGGRVNDFIARIRALGLKREGSGGRRQKARGAIGLFHPGTTTPTTQLF